MAILETIRALQKNWLQPRQAVHHGEICPLMLACSFSEEAATIDEANSLALTLPEHVLEFWRVAAWGRLFEDRQYGQWGLQILGPAEALEETRQHRKQRPREFVDGDLIVGRFLGDSDMLVVRCGRSAPDFGKVLVATPLDPRREWYTVGSSFHEFLEQYVTASGEKYWE